MVKLKPSFWSNHKGTRSFGLTCFVVLMSAVVSVHLHVVQMNMVELADLGRPLVTFELEVTLRELPTPSER